MNAARLLSHYETVAEAPGAIPRLRRLLLDLAIRGKLVLQDLTDEPATTLLQRIKTEKSRLAREEGLGAGTEQPPGPPDRPFALPSNWQWSHLAEVGFISPRNQAPDEFKASFVPMPLVAAAYGTPVDHEVRRWGDIRSGYTHFADGDVGLAKITPCFENGKSTVFRGLTGGFGAGTTELHVVRPVLIDPDYVLVFLKSPYFIANGIPKMTGTAGQKRVPASYFAFSPFPLPPIAEQRRIVAKIDELMTLCGQLEDSRTTRDGIRDQFAAATLARLNNPNSDSFGEDARFAVETLLELTARPNQIGNIRRTVMNLAVRGKLVAQDPGDEPTAELMRRVAPGRARQSRSGGISCATTVSPGGHADVDPSLQVPESWSMVSMRDVLCELQTGPFGSSLHKTDYEIGGTPVVNPASIQDGRLVPIAKMAVGPATLDRLSSFRLKAGDIVMARRGEMGRCALVTENEAGWLCGTGSLILRPAPVVFGQFLVMMISSPFAREYLSASCVGSTMQNLNQSILLRLRFGLPPLAEQRRIVSRVQELMSLFSQLEGYLSAALAARDRLLDSLIAEALPPTFLGDAAS